jgi:hypothetical protein
MADNNTNADKSSWAVGGGALMGTGIGFLYLEKSPIILVGSILIGIGLSLVLTFIMSKTQ